MKFCIKQQVLSVNEKYDILDERGIPMFYAVGRHFSPLHNITLYSADGKKVGAIKQRFTFIKRRYRLYVHGEHVADMNAVTSVVEPEYRIGMLDWSVKGDFAHYSYAIRSQEGTVASMRRDMYSIGDCYVLDVIEDRHNIISIAIIIALDCIRVGTFNTKLDLDR